MITCSNCNALKTRLYKKLNKEKVRDYEKNRLLTDPLHKMTKTVSNLISGSFKRACNGKYIKTSRSEEILGCTMPEFLTHLEDLFKEGMTFKNHGACQSGNCDKVWHIDHKIPISSAKTEEDIIRLNHYTNLQPMWALDNLKKWNK